MAEQWRIFVVENDESLNQNIVNSLRKDGYVVNAVTSGAEGVRVLWNEAYDVVICDLKTPGIDGLELLQWLRAFRPNIRVIVIESAEMEVTRTQMLENGAVGYLENPLDIRLLKDELRRLLSQTGFSASLDSFDLLDVIQMIAMSRKGIALLVNTGLEERGLLCFQEGELVWAEYGILRGEEAFFALAAYKNGTVIQQAWNERVVPNVRLPLSRLILQALQYRAKYAQMQQLSGELEPVKAASEAAGEYEDSPFLVLSEEHNGQAGSVTRMVQERKEGMEVLTSQSTREEQSTQLDMALGKMVESPVVQDYVANSTPPPEKEWWEKTGKYAGMPVVPANRSVNTDVPVIPVLNTELDNGSGRSTIPSTAHKTSAGQRSERDDLPSWLTEQPTAEVPAIRPEVRPAITQPLNLSPSEWQGPATVSKQRTGPQKQLQTDRGRHKSSSPEWQGPEQPAQTQSAPLQSLSTPIKLRKIADIPASGAVQDTERNVYAGRKNDSDITAARPLQTRKYNSAALVSALQPLGYSIHGFIAVAVVDLDGQAIAQIAVENLDISRICKNLSIILKSVLQSLEQGAWGEYEDTVITSVDRHILMRLVGGEHTVFQVLITTRQADPTESAGVMANIEGAIAAALRS